MLSGIIISLKEGICSSTNGTEIERITIMKTKRIFFEEVGVNFSFLIKNIQNINKKSRHADTR